MPVLFPHAAVQITQISDLYIRCHVVNTYIYSDRSRPAALLWALRFHYRIKLWWVESINKNYADHSLWRPLGNSHCPFSFWYESACWWPFVQTQTDPVHSDALFRNRFLCSLIMMDTPLQFYRAEMVTYDGFLSPERKLTTTFTKTLWNLNRFNKGFESAWLSDCRVTLLFIWIINEKWRYRQWIWGLKPDEIFEWNR